MIVSIIVAMDLNRGIGFEGRVPWRLSTDLKLFKQTTMDHHLVVGRKTWESIGKPLPGRRMVVVTRQESYPAGGCDVVSSLQAALDLARSRSETECFIAGGGQIYAQVLPHTTRIYLTRVHAALPADTFFPEFNPSDWQVVESQEYPAGERDQFDFSYQILERGLQN